MRIHPVRVDRVDRVLDQGRRVDRRERWHGRRYRGRAWPRRRDGGRGGRRLFGRGWRAGSPERSARSEQRGQPEGQEASHHRSRLTTDRALWCSQAVGRGTVLVLAAPGADGPLPVRGALGGLLGRVLLGPEDDLPVLCIHEDGIALLELAGEQLLRERIQDLFLDRPLDRARSVDRVEALRGDERLGVLGELERELALLETLREDLRLLLDD